MRAVAGVLNAAKRVAGVASASVEDTSTPIELLPSPWNLPVVSSEVAGIWRQRIRDMDAAMKASSN